MRIGRLAPTTRRLYAEAFEDLWKWVGRAPPTYVRSIRAYDSLLAEYVTHAWEAGYTGVCAGNALSASVNKYPELRGRGNLTESWHLLNVWAY